MKYTLLLVSLCLVGCGEQSPKTTDATTAPATTRSDSATVSAPVDVDHTAAGARTADNSGINKRDHADQTALTPLDQGSSDADVGITTSLRKAIVDQKDLSTNAKNVKIITRDGKVTLRGPVASSDEQLRIGDLAKATAGVTAVDNQLEIAIK